MVVSRTANGLRIGVIAPPWVPVPPVEYGGTELVIDLLARGLVEAGNEVVLFTTGDSTCPVTRRWMHPHALGTAAAPRGEREHVEAAYRELADVDLIHDHTLAGPVRVGLHPTGTPVVTTAHGEFTPVMRRHFATAAARGVSVVAISHAQRSTAPGIPVAAVIHHGIEPERFPAGRGDGRYALFLGRMSPDKGAHRAIRIARAAGRRIILAAKMQEPEERRYFTERVEPLLGDDAIFVGEVGGRRKVELIGGAEALVNPIRWPEPFGLVMIEALACGTPVLTFPEGAAPEIVEDGRTGWLCVDEDDMASKLAIVSQIDRAACRASVRARFTAARMVREHLALYRRLIAEQPVIELPAAAGGVTVDAPAGPSSASTCGPHLLR